MAACLLPPEVTIGVLSMRFLQLVWRVRCTNERRIRTAAAGWAWTPVPVVQHTLWLLQLSSI